LSAATEPHWRHFHQGFRRKLPSKLIIR
ncbi:HAD-IB family hydrolase, partial [Klebsiella pneumoniae]|nr:HAD-IB family hydrolase [Klebsiella pneumoniae]